MEWKWKWGFKANSKRWQILAKTPGFETEKPFLLKFQHATRLVITSTHNFVPEKTSIPSLDTPKFSSVCQIHGTLGRFGVLENGIPKDSCGAGNGNGSENFFENFGMESKWSLEFGKHLEWK